ncbi:MAG: hypothetical protein LBP67_06615 [Bacteroidales bacterium]|jgi:hypothetical protein|nr:hypothetical protein [Bacteroidales bacterium]
MNSINKFDNFLAHIYLENKTFIDEYLLEEELAEVDDNIDYKYKNQILMI